MPIHMKFNSKLSKRDLVRAVKKTRKLQAYRAMVRRSKAAYVSDTTWPITPCYSAELQHILEWTWLTSHGERPVDAPRLLAPSTPPSWVFHSVDLKEVARKLERYA